MFKNVWLIKYLSNLFYSGILWFSVSAAAQAHIQCNQQRIKNRNRQNISSGLETNWNYPIASRASDLENLLALLNSTSPDFFPSTNLFACTTVSIKTHALNVYYNDHSSVLPRIEKGHGAAWGKNLKKGNFCSRNFILRALSHAELFSEGTLHKLWATQPMFEM